MGLRGVSDKLILKLTVVCAFMGLSSLNDASAQKSDSLGVLPSASVPVLADTPLTSPISKLKTSKERDPRRATLLSAALPGAGQIYNGKYWKLPILYGGMYALGHFIHLNHNFYKDFRQAYIIRINGGTDDYAAVLPNADQLIRLREYYRRNRDLLIILSAFTYLLNITDAAVDAHLSGFSVADDLELSLMPQYLPHQIQPVYAAGLRYKF
jgi:hypothetical protein